MILLTTLTTLPHPFAHTHRPRLPRLFWQYQSLSDITNNKPPIVSVFDFPRPFRPFLRVRPGDVQPINQLPPPPSPVYSALPPCSAKFHARTSRLMLVAERTPVYPYCILTSEDPVYLERIGRGAVKG